MLFLEFDVGVPDYIPEVLGLHLDGGVVLIEVVEAELHDVVIVLQYLADLVEVVQVLLSAQHLVLPDQVAEGLLHDMHVIAAVRVGFKIT